VRAALIILVVASLFGGCKKSEEPRTPEDTCREVLDRLTHAMKKLDARMGEKEQKHFLGACTKNAAAAHACLKEKDDIAMMACVARAVPDKMPGEKAIPVKPSKPHKKLKNFAMMQLPE